MAPKPPETVVPSNAAAPGCLRQHSSSCRAGEHGDGRAECMLVYFHAQTGPGLACQANASADDIQRIPDQLLARDDIVV